MKDLLRLWNQKMLLTRDNQKVMLLEPSYYFACRQLSRMHLLWGTPRVASWWCEISSCDCSLMWGRPVHVLSIARDMRNGWRKVLLFFTKKNVLWSKLHMWRKELTPKSLNFFFFFPKTDTYHGVHFRYLSIRSSLHILENTFYSLHSLLGVKINFFHFGGMDLSKDSASSLWWFHGFTYQTERKDQTFNEPCFSVW